jgi:hypothetical protein
LEPDVTAKNDQNLYCIDASGHAVWRAVLPDASGPDCYLSAMVDGDHVVAATWSGFRVVLDLASGAIREAEFTK